MRRVLLIICFIGALPPTPARASAILFVEVDGPVSFETAFGAFPERGWGTAATGTAFIPNASVHDGLAPCCGEHVGGHASAQAKVDTTRGSAGASAFAQHPGNDEFASAFGQGAIDDVVMFFAPQFTITMDLIGSVFSNITGDAEGSYGVSMSVSLTADDPSNPDTDLEFYRGSLERFLDSDGTRKWGLGSTVSGFQSGTGSGPPLHLSDTFDLPFSAIALPITLSMIVIAEARCAEGTGNCSTSAQAFETGYLGITGTYSSTHSYPGLQPTTVPEPHSFALLCVGVSVSAWARGRWRRR